MDTGAYPPLDTLKPVGEGIWLADGPPIRFYGMPFATRATIVRLSDGGLWVHSPIRWSQGLADELTMLGPVRHLIAPNWIHYAHIPGWQAQYPKARCWAAPGVGRRAASRQVALRIDHDLTGTAPTAWAGEIDQLLVAGSRIHREVVFFLRATRTLILTDLIENFEAARLPLWMRPLAWLGGILDPDGKMPVDMRLSFRDRAALRQAVETMIAWGPERIILAHGRWYDRDGVAELRRAFRHVLS